MTFYPAEGVQESVLTGREGTYWTRTSQMSERGDVVVVRTSDQARLKTDFLEYDPSKTEVRTDRPYVADKGAQHIEGVGFTCDPGFVNCSTQHAKGAAGRGLQLIISRAGGAAALPGMAASLAPLPVLWGPGESNALKGIVLSLSLVPNAGRLPVAHFAVGPSGATK